MLFQVSLGTSSFSMTDIIVIFIIIILYLLYRIYRSTKGMKYTERNVYRGPLLYLILVFLGIAVLNPTYIEIISVILSIIIGYFVGRKLSGGVSFFEKNNTTYYRRSPAVLILWVISFLVRFIIEIFYPTNFILALITEIILAITTGIILGEAHHILISYGKYSMKKHSSKQ